MTRAVAYARVSTTRQAQHDVSIPDQLRQIATYCEAQGFELVREYVEPGASGMSDKRPVFRAMIADACSGARDFDVIVFCNLSRFSRSAVDRGIYERKLAKHHVRLVSVLEDFGDDPNGKLIKGVLMSVYEHQSDFNSLNTTNAMLENARLGFWNGAAPPFGYRTYVAEVRGKKEKKKLEPEPREAAIVRRAFELYVTGTGSIGPLGIKEVVTRLNEEGYRNRQGKPFRVQFLGTLLRNTAYIGTHYFNRTDSRTREPRPPEEWIRLEVPKIVDEALFDAAQRRLDQNHPLKTPPRITNGPTLLTGIAYCGKCGKPMKLQTGKGSRYRYYKCGTRADSGKQACEGCSVPMAKLDDAVLGAFSERVLTTARLKKLASALFSRASNRQEMLQTELRRLEREKRETRKALDNLYQAIAGGVDMDASLKSHIETLQSRYGELARLVERTTGKLNVPDREPSPEQFDLFRNALMEKLHDPENPGLRKAYLRSFISRVEVRGDEVWITGSKTALYEHLTAPQPLPPKVLSSEQEWRARRDSNSRPPDS